MTGERAKHTPVLTNRYFQVTSYEEWGHTGLNSQVIGPGAHLTLTWTWQV